MKEIIKPISNYDGYFISNLGKVYFIRDEKGLFVSNFKYEI